MLEKPPVTAHISSRSARSYPLGLTLNIAMHARIAMPTMHSRRVDNVMQPNRLSRGLLVVRDGLGIA